MSKQFNQEQFIKLAKKIEEDANLNIQTKEELDIFAKENPERFEKLISKVKEALNDSVVGGTFEELDVEQMEALQGAGDINVETSPGAAVVTLGVAVGIAWAKYGTKK